MFRLLSADLKNWCQHQHTRIDFARGTNGIVGSNGRGKSNLVNGIFTGLTGRIAVGTTEENINFDADETTITVSFEQDGVVGECCRTFKAPRDEYGIRSDLKSGAWLTFGDEPKITGVRKVTQRLEELTGFTPKVIDEHIFVSQDKLVALLFQPRTERLKSFMLFIPEVAQAEDKRTALAQELARFPEIEVGLKKDTLREQRENLTTAIAETTGLISGLEAQLATFDVSKAHATLSARSTGLAAQQSCDRLRTNLQTVTARINDLTVAQAELDTRASALQIQLDELRPYRDDAQKELATVAQRRQLFEMRRRAQEDLTRLLAEVGSAGVPDDGGRMWEQVPEWSARRDAMVVDLHQAKKIFDLLNTGSTECPTCGNQFSDPQTQLQTAKTTFDKLSPELQKLRELIGQAQQAQRTYEAEVARYTQWVDQTQRRIAELNEQLQNTPEVQLPDVKRVADLTKVVTDHDALATSLRAAEQQAAAVHTDLSVAQTSQKQLEEQIAGYEIAVAKLPTAAEAEQASADIQQHARLQASYNEAAGRLRAQTESLDMIKRQEEEVAQVESRADAVRKYRDLLGRSRDILHRDQLPSEVLAARLDQLNALTNRYLQHFGSPFAIEIGRDMGIAFTMPSGYKGTSAERLSGGQKCVLSVAFRFAINEMFARGMGLLVLDEPTAWMDQENLESVGRVIEQTQLVSAASGVQTVIITHARELIPCFERVIDLT